MKKYIFLIIFSVCSFLASGQRGMIFVQLDENESNLRVEILQQNSIIRAKLLLEEDFFLFKNLKQGYYTIKINHADGRTSLYTGLEVINDSITNLIITNKYRHLSLDASEIDTASSLFYYANALAATPKMINDRFTIFVSTEIGINYWKKLTKNFQGGFNVSLYYDYLPLKKPKNWGLWKSEKYTNIGFNPTFKLRFYPMGLIHIYSKGFFIDCGINYKIPIFNRFVTKDTYGKTITKFKNWDNNVNSNVTLGYRTRNAEFQIISNYRVLDSKQISKTPRWAFGLGFAHRV